MMGYRKQIYGLYWTLTSMEAFSHGDRPQAVLVGRRLGWKNYGAHKSSSSNGRKPYMPAPSLSPHFSVPIHTAIIAAVI
jgi:hypothetical protein